MYDFKYDTYGDMELLYDDIEDEDNPECYSKEEEPTGGSSLNNKIMVIYADANVDNMNTGEENIVGIIEEVINNTMENQLINDLGIIKIRQKLIIFY